jgi:hypothetical protein
VEGGRSRPLFSTRPARAGGEMKGRGEDGDVTVASSCAASQRIPRSSSHHDDFILPTFPRALGEVCEINYYL